jgi:hypothetical protein
MKSEIQMVKILSKKFVKKILLEFVIKKKVFTFAPAFEGSHRARIRSKVLKILSVKF